MKPGSKYYPLFERLKQSQPSVVHLSFSEIEHILGNPLPASARQQRAWWSNRESDRALQAKAWIDAGYHTTAVNLEQETLSFRPFQAQYTVQRSAGTILWDQAAIKALRKSMGLTQSQFAQELGVRRQTVSEWETGVYEPERSTAKHLERIAAQQNF
ncbi:MAG: helix-turn-helix transcriptional regulator [Synechococcales cyanobacterium CRU_2_2]|nr:helix-turn-helix transcriptional regulator [Synechococcales cyanobacterium CRU_2_2]